MKWLKLFEGFESNDYYQEISGDDYTGNNTNVVYLSDKNRSKIESWFSSDPNNTIYDRGKGITISFKEGFLYIYELEDEWFDVTFVSLSVKNSWNLPIHRISSGTSFYKCDQLDGLKKLFTDKGFIQ